MLKTIIGRCAFALVVVTGLASAQNNNPVRSARDYFNELRAANQLNRFSDTYVCLADDDVPSFAVISRGSDIIDEMRHAGTKLTKEVLAAKKLLFVQIYFKGVPNETEIYEPVGAEGTDWNALFDRPFKGKIVYSINWATGRYRMRVYSLTHSSAVPAAERSGKCELIHPGQ